MKPPYFGTDGIRDAVAGPLLSESFVRRVGAAIGRLLAERHGPKPLHVVIGRDTRESGARIALWLTEGLVSRGVHVFDAGVVPTAAVALAVRDLDIDRGIVVTASHNPASDNGIKLFGPGGCKLRGSEEREIEDMIDRTPEVVVEGRAPAAYAYDARRHFKNFARSLLHENSLVGLTLAVDSGHGATTATTADVLEDLGARVIRMGCAPNGANINQNCGSEHPESLAAAVKEYGAAAGFAHDGDGDRVVVVDEAGELVDGDQVLGVIALRWRRAGRLDGNTVVATVMSNQGLEAALARNGVQMDRVPVGDRNVLHRMLETGAVFGGESSGHIICRPHLPTGDGLVAALELMSALLATRKPLSELRREVPLFPQKLVNLPVRDKPPLDTLPAFEAALVGIRRELGTSGRILVRYSGTEPKVRLLAEAETSAHVDSVLEKLRAAAARHLPLREP